MACLGGQFPASAQLPGFFSAPGNAACLAQALGACVCPRQALQWNKRWVCVNPELTVWNFSCYR